MTAPALWIIFPFLLGVLLLLFGNQRLLSIVGGSVVAGLALVAQFIPIDQALRVGAFSFRIDSSLSVLGRTLILLPTEGSLLALIYGAAALWFFGAEASRTAPKLVPMGLMITSLMIASLAVEPFLYAALFIEMAILLSIPLLTSLTAPPGPGIVRFLIYQTLAMPFILMTGWLLAGVEASPGDLALAAQSATMLGLGFAFLLAVFPLYNWVPMLVEETSPYIAGFMLWILPTVTIVFGAGFLDRYSWLRSSTQILSALRIAGLVMVLSGGVFAGFQRHFGRIMAYGSIVETGFSMLALSLAPRFGISLLFLLMPARALGMALWSLALTVVQTQTGALRFNAGYGILRKTPLAGAGMVLAALSTGMFPLLAGFPIRLALWDALAQVSIRSALVLGIGLLGLLVGAFRSLAVISQAEEFESWERNETWSQTLMLGVGILGLLVFGLFPQALQYFVAGLPAMFEHFAR